MRSSRGVTGRVQRRSVEVNRRDDPKAGTAGGADGGVGQVDGEEEEDGED